MSIRSAVILAAGRGTRLAGELSDRPKGFLELGGGPIIAGSVASLVRAGIEDILIVTGHLAHWYEDYAAGEPQVRTVHNPRFAESGSMYSLACAAGRVAGPFLLLESDLVYEPRALDCLLGARAPDAVLLSGPTGAGDEVFVAAAAGQLLAMSKQPAELPADPLGELVGISKISEDLFKLMLEISAARFEHSLAFDYETDCLVAAAAMRPIACPLVPDLVWGEIDDPAHLARVRNFVYPEIVRRRAATG